MQIITITIQEQGEQTAIAYYASDGVTPGMGEAACRFVADQFQARVIEAEVQRRVEAAQAAEEDAATTDAV